MSASNILEREAMRADLTVLHRIADAFGDFGTPKEAENIRAAIAELSALRAAQVGADVRAENERLRAALKSAVDAINAPPSGYSTYHTAMMDNEELAALYACAKAVREAAPLVTPKPEPLDFPDVIRTRTGQTFYLCDDGGYRPQPSANVGARIGAGADLPEPPA